jgi:hypothetical protein
VRVLRSWEQERFQEDVEAWVDACLGEHGLQRRGSLETVKVRPWSAVFRARTDRRSAYFKALCPLARHEPALVERLARSWPEQLPRVLGADAERGWLLTEDGGPTLLQTNGLRDPDHWLRALAQYAELQRETTEIREWLELGVPDRRLERLPELIATLLDDEDSWCADGPDCPPPTELRALRKHLDWVRPICEELRALGIPAALHHGDLHDGNIFPTPSGYCLFDWGDSSVTHPFFSMVVALSDDDIASPDRARMIAAYLGPWVPKLSAEICERAMPLALRLGPVVRALEWHAVLIGASDAARAEWLPRAWLWLRRAFSSPPATA